MVAEKPTILFLLGAWHQPSHFAGIRKYFEDAGYPTSCPMYPSIGSLPPIGLMDDAQCIRDELTRLVDEQGKDVVVAGHSYGGMVMSEAVDKAFAKQTRLQEGKTGGVLHLVYIAAFILPLNVTLAESIGGKPAPWLVVNEQGMGIPDDPISLFYNDVAEADQQRYAKDIRKCPTSTTLYTPLTQTAWIWHPVTYLLCEDDRALPPAHQRFMIDDATAKHGLKVNVETCSAGHSPFMSMPERVFEVVSKVAVA